MAKENALLDFHHRFQRLQEHHDTSGSLMRELLLHCEAIEINYTRENQLLAKQLEETQLDLADSTNSRRELQKRIEISDSRCTSIAHEFELSKSRNPYVTVLIDGDGLIFQESYIRAGIEGGKKAAYTLRAAVADACRETHPNVEVSAKVVANLSGLSRAMVRDCSLDNPNDLKDFTLGFTQAQASFDFVDVGYGKERADSKIRENLRWHLQNQNCQQILLGISHDAGYAPFLDEILQDEKTRRRVTILEGVPTVRDLVATGVNIFRIEDDLFRDDKLTDRNQLSSGTSPRTSNTAPSVTSTSHSPPPSSTAASPFSSYAGMARKVRAASPPPKITMPLAPRSNNARSKTQTPQPKWNPGPRGFDEPIKVDQAVLNTIKTRKDNKKLCNNHFLRGPCSKGDSCQFVHKYRPSPDELCAIAWLSRLNPCTSGQDCEAEDCIYGHHCPSTKDGLCTHPYCKFPTEAHPPNAKYKNAHIKENC